MFVAVSYPDRTNMNFGISIVGYNENDIDPADAYELQLKIYGIDPSIELVPMSSLKRKVMDLRQE